MRTPLTPSFALLFAAGLFAQQNDPAAALAKAQLLETHEGDLAAAETAYRALLDDPAAKDVHAQVALRLGAMLWRLEKKDAARPFLERAVGAGGAIGEQATAVLQGLGDAKLAEEQRIKAEALVARYRELQRTPRVKDQLPPEVGMRCSEIGRDLQSLGAIGAQAVVAGTKAEIANDADTRSVRGALIALLWRIGGAPAIKALRTWSKSSDVAVRREVAESCQNTKVANDLEPVLLDYVSDPDPAGDVWRAATSAVTWFSFEQRCKLAKDPDPALRAAGLQSLGDRWGNLTREQQQHVVDDLGASIQQDSAASDSRVSRIAWLLLSRLALSGTSGGAHWFCSVAERCPDYVPAWAPQDHADADDAWIHAVASAARRVGPRQRNDPRSSVRTLSAMLESPRIQWTEASVDDVIDLLQLGYGENGKSWWQPVVRLANAPQLARLLPISSKDLHNVIELLQARELPAELFPTLRDLIEDCLAKRIPEWTSYWSSTQREVRRQTVTLQYCRVGEDLLKLTGATKNPAAAAWLAALPERHPVLLETCIGQLCLLSQSGVGPEAHAALRKMLVWEGTPDIELPPRERSRVFGELARSGDVEAIPLFPRAYELGLANHQPTGLHFFAPRGLGFLANIGEMTRNADSKPFHGYGEADLVRAWRVLLESPQAHLAWSDLGVDRIDAGKRSIPIPVLPLLCEHLPAIWRHAANHNAQNSVQANACRAFGMLNARDIPPGSPLREALGKLLRTDDATLAQAVFVYLWPEVAQPFAAEGRDILRRTADDRFFDTLMRASIELLDDDWAAVLTNSKADVRYRALDLMPATVARRLRPVVEAQLANAEQSVRRGACKAMQRVFGDDSVVHLLPLLQDADEQVRKQARESLEQLKQEHEQRTFWAAAKSGIDTSSAGAAAKLLTQAKAGEPKEQRLLAIRSLAVLAAAESLPYLIDHSKDPDAEIAAAARSAITEIHRRATPAPASK